MKCAVIGGKGFVGSAVAAEAAERGDDVTIIDLDNYDSCIGRSFDLLINANGNSRKYLASHEPTKEFELSVQSVIRVLHDFKADRYVHLSTIDVYNDHSNPANNSESATIDPPSLSPYGFHKYLAEQIARYYAEDWLIFRMAGFVGSGLWKNSIYDLLKKEPLRVHPDSEYQYLHTRELARIIFAVVDASVSGEVFNVAGDGVVSLRTIASWLPDSSLTLLSEDVKQERYEVNIEKVKKFRPPPSTDDTVRAFVTAVLNAEEELA